ncbi:hypothetical protein [Actinoplanes sp. NPDC026623]
MMGSVVWLVVVLLALALGLAGALLAATRGNAARMHAERHAPER